MKKQAIIKKIEKLLNLADDQNSQAEAESAARKAQKLIMKFNIDQAELHKGEVTEMENALFAVYEIERKSQEGKWLRDLFGGIARNNFCRIVITKKYVDGKPREHFYILGEKANVELVKYLGVQLTHRLRSISRDEQAKYDGPLTRNKFYRRFLAGCASGVATQLAAQREEFKADEKSNALIIRKDQEVVEFRDEQFPHLGKARSAGLRGGRDAYSKGRATGQKVSINAGMRGAGGSKMING